MFVAMMIYYGVRPGIPFLFFPLFLFLRVLTATGMGLWLGAMNALYRDVRYARPVSRSVLALRLAGGLSGVAGSCEVALALWFESHGGGDRGFPLVAFRPRCRPRAPHLRFRTDHCGRARFRAILFPEDGSDDCRCGVKRR